MSTIFPSRGIRQGDMLFLYFFILCAKWPLSLVQDAENWRLIWGVLICNGTPMISHFFCDYNLLFCRANIVEKCALKYLINIYAQASTHQINMEKTTLLISKKFWGGWGECYKGTLECIAHSTS